MGRPHFKSMWLFNNFSNDYKSTSFYIKITGLEKSHSYPCATSFSLLEGCTIFCTSFLCIWDSSLKIFKNQLKIPEGSISMPAARHNESLVWYSLKVETLNINIIFLILKSICLQDEAYNSKISLRKQCSTEKESKIPEGSYGFPSFSRDGLRKYIIVGSTNTAYATGGAYCGSWGQVF